MSRRYEVEIEFSGRCAVVVEAESDEGARERVADEWCPEDYLEVWTEAACPPHGSLVSADITVDTEPFRVRVEGEEPDATEGASFAFAIVRDDWEEDSGTS